MDEGERGNFMHCHCNWLPRPLPSYLPAIVVNEIPDWRPFFQYASCEINRTARQTSYFPASAARWAHSEPRAYTRQAPCWILRSVLIYSMMRHVGRVLSTTETESGRLEPLR